MGRGLHSLNALIGKLGRKEIQKPKKVFKKYHNPAVAQQISELLLGFSNNIYGPVQY